MQLNRLGNKSGIAGIILAALGLGGGSFSDQIAAEFAPPPPYVSYENRQTVQALQEAVNRLARVITHGGAITTQIKENVEVIRRQAAETTTTALEEGKAEVLQTRDEVVATVRESLNGLMVKAASWLSGIVGIFMTSAGFRSSASRRDATEEDAQ
ncbi:MAG: hypothetical protein AAGJ81_01465 [Verrucomicrobiota bacterium]